MAFTALAAGVSGLQAFSEGVGVIADNITNVNTIGYKESRSRFSTLVTETAAISSYSPGGVRSFTETLVRKQGLLQPSSSATDLSIDGAGFFVVRLGDDANDQQGEYLFTRAGNFTQDSEGYFKNTAGLYMLGWPVDANGDIPANQNDLSLLQPINIDNLNGFGEATQNVGVRANLQSTTAVNAAYTTVGQLASNAVSADFETNVQIFDSQGGGHTVVFKATKTAANTWGYEIVFDDPTELAAAHTNGLIASGTLAFNTDGTVDLGNTDMDDIAGNPITVPGGSLPFTYASTSTDVDPGSVTFDFGSDGEADGFTQFDSLSTLISSSVDGAQFGNVNGISIGEDGDVTALFDNGLTLTVFKLPVATFPNADGLARRQGNAYGVSDLSGRFALQTAGNGGGGTVAPNSLEMSTVDLSNEFSELIKVQRAFSASSKIITTSDEILEELVRLI